MQGNQIPGGDTVSYSMGLDTTGTARTLTTSATQGNCDMLDIRGVHALAIKPVSSGAAITTVTFYACDTSTGTFVLINDLGTAGVVTLPDSKWTVVDWTKLAPHRFIQMQADQTGTIIVMGKS